MLEVTCHGSNVFNFQLGRSTEDIQNKTVSSDDEFENSVDEILEREGALESDREATDQEVGITDRQTDSLRIVLMKF